LTFVLVCFLFVVNQIQADPPHRGPYKTVHVDYPLLTLHPPFTEVVVVAPVPTVEGETFPFISFAHGFTSGGPQTYPWHTGLFTSLASHGFIVGATKSCMFGCENYWEEQYKVIYWTQSLEMQNDTIIGTIDHSIGYGLAGHSMGGEATARSAARASVKNVKQPFCFILIIHQEVISDYILMYLLQASQGLRMEKNRLEAIGI